MFVCFLQFIRKEVISYQASLSFCLNQWLCYHVDLVLQIYCRISKQNVGQSSKWHCCVFFNRFPSLVQWVMRQECAQPSAERRRKEEVFIFEAFDGFRLLISEFWTLMCSAGVANICFYPNWRSNIELFQFALFTWCCFVPFLMLLT